MEIRGWMAEDEVPLRIGDAFTLFMARNMAALPDGSERRGSFNLREVFSEQGQ
jgi:hypothetical protein